MQRWFYRNAAAEPAPIRLDRRRIYILPTRSGLLFGAVIAAMYVGAINYNLGLGHALVFLLAGLGTVAMLHTYRNLVDLELTPGRTEPCFAGERLNYRIIVHNPTALRRFSLSLSCGEARTDLEMIHAGDRRPMELSVPVERRGLRPLGRLRIESRYPLGIFRAWSYPFPDATGLVYPKPVYSELPPPSPGARPGALQGESGDEDFSGFRVRQPADSLRHIAWKAFARDPDRQPLLVKTFSGGTMPELWLDWRRLSEAEDDETRLSRLCGWVLQASRDGIRYGLRLPGREMPQDEGSAHRDACLERLALFEAPRGPA